jgi:quercetin dioxygenase-like cupin family protein
VRRIAPLLFIVAVLVLASVAVRIGSGALAQDATPAVEGFAPEGIAFEVLGYADGLALPATGELSVSRVTFAPGAGFPIEEGDPTYTLAVVERGELTVRLDGPLIVTRAGALAAALAAEGTEGAAATPAAEPVADGQAVTLAAGDAVLFPPNAGGEVGNAGQEDAVVLVVFVGPPPADGTPQAGTPEA